MKRALFPGFARHVQGKRVVCLDIPDDDDDMQPALIALLAARAGRFLG